MAIVTVIRGARWQCRVCGAGFLIADDRDPQIEAADYHMRSEHGVNDPSYWARSVLDDDHSPRLTQSWYSFEIALQAGRHRHTGFPF